MQVKTIISVFKASFYHWKNHRASRMGAALSYYTIFSIVPLLMLVLVVIGSFMGNSYMETAVVGQVRTLINPESANFIQSILTGLGETKFNLFAILAGIGTLIAGTVGVFYELKNSLDDLWDTKEVSKEIKGWKYFFSSRLLSLFTKTKIAVERTSSGIICNNYSFYTWEICYWHLYYRTCWNITPWSNWSICRLTFMGLLFGPNFSVRRVLDLCIFQTIWSFEKYLNLGFS